MAQVLVGSWPNLTPFSSSWFSPRVSRRLTCFGCRRGVLLRGAPLVGPLACWPTRRFQTSPLPAHGREGWPLTQRISKSSVRCSRSLSTSFHRSACGISMASSGLANHAFALHVRRHILTPDTMMRQSLLTLIGPASERSTCRTAYNSARIFVLSDHF